MPDLRDLLKKLLLFVLLFSLLAPGLQAAEQPQDHNGVCPVLFQQQAIVEPATMFTDPLDTTGRLEALEEIPFSYFSNIRKHLEDHFGSRLIINDEDLSLDTVVYLSDEDFWTLIRKVTDYLLLHNPLDPHIYLRLVTDNETNHLRLTFSENGSNISVSETRGHLLQRREGFADRIIELIRGAQGLWTMDAFSPLQHKRLGIAGEILANIDDIAYQNIQYLTESIQSYMLHLDLIRKSVRRLLRRGHAKTRKTVVQRNLEQINSRVFLEESRRILEKHGELYPIELFPLGKIIQGFAIAINMVHQIYSDPYMAPDPVIVRGILLGIQQVEKGFRRILRRVAKGRRITVGTTLAIALPSIQRERTDLLEQAQRMLIFLPRVVHDMKGQWLYLFSTLPGIANSTREEQSETAKLLRELEQLSQHVGEHLRRLELNSAVLETLLGGIVDRTTQLSEAVQHDLVKVHARIQAAQDSFWMEILNNVLPVLEALHPLNSFSKHLHPNPAKRRTVETIDLRDFIEGIGKSFLGVHVEINRAIPEPFITMADPDHLATVFYNLLRNADNAHATKVVFDLSAGHDFVTIRMGDDGDPIPDFIRARIFEAGITGGGGTGQGLAIAHSNMRGEGGNIQLEDPPVMEGWELKNPDIATGEIRFKFRLHLPLAHHLEEAHHPATFQTLGEAA